jgi:hypothetical protein
MMTGAEAARAVFLKNLRRLIGEWADALQSNSLSFIELPNMLWCGEDIFEMAPGI